MAAELAVDSIAVILRDADTGGPPLQEAIRALQERGVRVEVEAAAQDVAAVSLAEKAVHAGVGAIVAAGGDGTLNEVINGAFRPNLDYGFGVGVIPLGTSNDFARQCNIPLDDPAGALDIVAAGRAARIDLGRMNGRLFANVALGGALAEISSDTPSTLKKVFGSAAYILQGLTSVGQVSTRHMKIHSPIQDWEGDAYLLYVGNGRLSGSTAEISRTTLVDDGKLDVCIVPDLPLPQLLSIGRAVMNQGGLAGLEGVVYFQTPALEVISKGLQINLDGQPFAGEEFHFDLIEKSLPFFMPLETARPDFLS